MTMQHFEVTVWGEEAVVANDLVPDDRPDLSKPPCTRYEVRVNFPTKSPTQVTGSVTISWRGLRVDGKPAKMTLSKTYPLSNQSGKPDGWADRLIPASAIKPAILEALRRYAPSPP